MLKTHKPYKHLTQIVPQLLYSNSTWKYKEEGILFISDGALENKKQG